MNRIASFILDLVKQDVKFTDMQIKENLPISFRVPGRYQKSEFISSTEDVQEFVTFADKDFQEKLEKGGGQFNVAFNVGGVVKLRCNFFKEGIDNRLACALRRIPLQISSMNELGIPMELKKQVMTNVQGLVLIVGPTGAGKTTTQFSIAEELNKEWPMHIITLESPIEYELTPKMSVISQREIPTNVESFSKALEAARRQRPELIVIGEVLDKETVDSLFKAAETGHLVLAGTHANSAEDAIETILGWYQGSELEQKRIQLSKSILAINAQRLLPSVDGKDNVLAYDLFVPNDAVRNLIREGKIAAIRNSILSGNRNGSKLFNEVLVELVNKKKISIAVAEKATSDIQGFHKEMQKG